MKCSYCGNELRRGSGLMYIFRTGKINYYCSNQCYQYDIVLHRAVKGARKAAAAVAAEVKEGKERKEKK